MKNKKICISIVLLLKIAFAHSQEFINFRERFDYYKNLAKEHKRIIEALMYNEYAHKCDTLAKLIKEKWQEDTLGLYGYRNEIAILLKIFFEKTNKKEIINRECILKCFGYPDLIVININDNLDEEIYYHYYTFTDIIGTVGQGRIIFTFTSNWEIKEITIIRFCG